MNDDRLRAVYAEMVAARASAGRGGCATPESIQALVDRDGPEAERLAVLDHVMACPHCKREFELLRSVGRTGPAMTRRAWPRRPLAIAATVTLLVTATLYWRTTGDRRPTFRNAATTVTLISPSGEQPAGSPLRLVWNRLEQAVRYEVEILDEAGSPVWSLTTTDTVVLVPDSMDIGTDVARRWWVQATLQDSRTVRSTMLQFVRR